MNEFMRVLRSAAMLLAGIVCAVSAASAQVPDNGRWMHRHEQTALRPVIWQQQRDPRAQRPGPRARPLPPQMLERLKGLSPEERERVLENNRRFRQLPPAQQEQLRARLRELQEMTPEQRELIEQRFAIFSNLTPRQQERARQIYERRWRRISAERRRALLQEFRRLRAMNHEERRQRFESEELQSQFDAEERDLLTQLISIQEDSVVF
jgi:hypothetical protein